MFRSFVCMLMALHTLCSGFSDPSFRTTAAMKTGTLLRLHVVAQDDTPEMQALKLVVRDGVQEAYAAQPRDPSDTMLTHTEKLLPILAQAARDTAQANGYDRPINVLLGWFDFDRHEEDGLVIPAGRYPALIIRLGEAQGHNWWGLVDPAAALDAAAADHDQDILIWDWSLEALLSALFTFSIPAGDIHA